MADYNDEIEAIHVLMKCIDTRPHTRKLFYELLDLLMKLCEDEVEEI